MTDTHLENVRAKLVGQLVATPLIGSIHLPGVRVDPSLRIKAECVQVAGGVWFRGAMAWIGSRLGALKGLVVSGQPRPAFAAVCAANAHRVPVVAVLLEAEVDADTAALFRSVECEVVMVASSQAVDPKVARLVEDRGYAPMPGLESAPYRDGVATLGLELAEELPFDTAIVFVAPAVLAAPVEQGLRAGGRGCAVRGVEADADWEDLEDLCHKVRIGLRMVTDPVAVAALRQAMIAPAGASPCVVLSS